MSSAPENAPEPTGEPWVCPDCGTATNRSHCTECLRERPPDFGQFENPGSYLGIVGGPMVPRASGRPMYNPLVFLGIVFVPSVVIGLVLLVRFLLGR
ncbi:MAG: hypothetical protein KIS66_09385 [Fimbriimonadaceae bacterium]|nr:hypothetical protein [Fimbriimonadaceae bacterium]